MQYITCMVGVNAICYLHGGCSCSVTCVMHVIAVCYLHGGC